MTRHFWEEHGRSRDSSTKKKHQLLRPDQSNRAQTVSSSYSALNLLSSAWRKCIFQNGVQSQFKDFRHSKPTTPIWQLFQQLRTSTVQNNLPYLNLSSHHWFCFFFLLKWRLLQDFVFSTCEYTDTWQSCCPWIFILAINTGSYGLIPSPGMRNVVTG